MESKEYRIIGSEPVDDGELDNLYGPKYSRKVHCLSYIAPVLLALSLAANILLLVHRLVPNTLVSAPLRSTFGQSARSFKAEPPKDNYQQDLSGTSELLGPRTTTLPVITGRYGIKHGVL